MTMLNQSLVLSRARAVQLAWRLYERRLDRGMHREGRKQAVLELFEQGVCTEERLARRVEICHRSNCLIVGGSRRQRQVQTLCLALKPAACEQDMRPRGLVAAAALTTATTTIRLKFGRLRNKCADE